MPKIESVHWQLKDAAVSCGACLTSGKLFRPLRSSQSPLCWQENLLSPSRNIRRDLCSFRRQCWHFVVVDNVPLISASITWLCHRVRVNSLHVCHIKTRNLRLFSFSEPTMNRKICFFTVDCDYDTHGTWSSSPGSPSRLHGGSRRVIYQASAPVYSPSTRTFCEAIKQFLCFMQFQAAINAYLGLST